jgi:HPt (histidine-containing phosphotransfer) domain-containing protein
MHEAGAAEAVDAILATFVDSAPERLAALAAAAGGTEPEPIQRAAHAFKSAATTIGAHALTARLAELEAIAQSGDVAGARDRLEHVRHEANVALDYLRRTKEGGTHG